ncbi:IEC3 subunit of the Ino80 complex, chromatin re-modelling-domain-containing protein [Elsinoe ampelina]|uniref:IEC3 subunit of the Ino80 complex, chromatin re-modelling-domain-containing protein n=1 Tax=Elsinoe ampelina TaxID=302913 RepID=A0A6A6G844_9PEZI|nr:IEC3 subunit of the Ino80 complex, chromatin re-modelling-domain-containing protein [Elsinoe ampelina]
MAEEDIAMEAAPSTSAPFNESSESRPKYKSWRKKYRKMKARFDDTMKTNSTMFKEEQKLEALAKRLQEQNDELLDMLLELNSTLQLPAELRYNIEYRKEWPEAEGIDSLTRANRMLDQYVEMGHQGRISQGEVYQMRTSLESHVAALESRSLASLEKEVPHTFLDDTDLNSVNEVADPVGYLTSQHESDYLDKFDLTWGDPLHGMPAPREKSPPAFSQMTARELEREVELRNPLSVHNWLKQHNINITETDDTKSDAGTPAGGKKGGRNLAKKMGDRAVERARERDDGSPMSSAAGRDVDGEEEEDGSSRRRKSRDADETYRPKGGRSGRSKRKRDDGESRGASKKPKTSLGGGSDA